MTTNQQIAALASVVTGIEYIECCFGPNEGGVSFIAEKEDPHSKPLWKPDKIESQRLQLIEWIAEQYADKIIVNPGSLKKPKLILECGISIYKLCKNLILFCIAIKNKDIDALHSIGVQLKGGGE